MDKSGTKALLFIAALGLGVGMMPAQAAQPLMSAKSTTRTDARAPDTRQDARQPEARMLDLHLPATLALDKESAAAPVAAHRTIMLMGGENSAPAQSGTGDARQTRIPGRVEEFAQRVRHEGLPVARLWENKAALVSLGLNQKGKPGLWLVQKVH